MNVTLPSDVAPSAVISRSAVSDIAPVPQGTTSATESLSQGRRSALPSVEGNIAPTHTQSVDSETISGVPDVYKFLELSSDRQNGGLVEKIVIPPAQVKGYCEAIAKRR